MRRRREPSTLRPSSRGRASLQSSMTPKTAGSSRSTAARRARYAQPKATVLADRLFQEAPYLALRRATEGSYGVSHCGARGRLYRGPMRRKPSRLRLEFVGDSITAGFLCDGRSAAKTTPTSDGSMSFCPAARAIACSMPTTACSPSPARGRRAQLGRRLADRGLHAERYPGPLRRAQDHRQHHLAGRKAAVSAVILALGFDDFSDAKRRPYHGYVQAWTSLIHRVHAMNPEGPHHLPRAPAAAVSPLAGL